MRGRRGSSTRHTFFATCAPGLEAALHAEAKELRLAKLERQVGGVRFEGAIEDAWRANLRLRTAVRVLLRVARFEAREEGELYRAVRDVEWRRFLRPGGTFAVSAQSRGSKLDHTLFIEQRTKDAIADELLEREGKRPSVDRNAPDLTVHVHLSHDRCTVSVDTTGPSLHKRGWRRKPGRAQLSETIAAGVVLLSGWDRRSPLVDPFCGSGTILVEAALIASGTAPGLFREAFAFERLPGHDARRWEALREKAREEVSTPPKLILRGSDRDAAAVARAADNARAAGFGDRIELRVAAATEIEFRRGWNAWIITNPPYGERVGDERKLQSLYSRFGRRLREQCGGYHLALLSGNPRLARSLGLVPQKVTRIQNGPIECELLELEIPR